MEAWTGSQYLTIGINLLYIKYRIDLYNWDRMAIYNSVIYSSIYGANYYLGFYTVNETNGSYIMSSFFTYFSQSPTDTAGMLIFIRL